MHVQAEKAAAAAAAGVKDASKTLVELRSEQGVARGQNTSLEKDYLRLTSLPRQGLDGSRMGVGWGWGGGVRCCCEWCRLDTS